MKRAAAVLFAAAGMVLVGGSNIGCGKVASRASADAAGSGGTSGTHLDGSARSDGQADGESDEHLDARSDRADEATDAHRDAPVAHDAAPTSDAHPIDAATKVDAASKTDAHGADGARHDAAMSDGPVRADAAPATCLTDDDCVSYPAGTGGCCGVCLPKSDPAPSKVQCLLPCLTPITSCTCTAGQCVGTATGL